MNNLPRCLRVYRLAVTLCGRPLAAEIVLDHLPETIPSGPRGERIAVQATRAIEPGVWSQVKGDAGLAGRLAALETPLREVWVLRDGLGLSERDTAIAMDCSRTVVRQRLEVLEGQFGRADIETLREAMAEIGLPPSFTRERKERSRARKALGILVVVAIVLVLLEVARRWAGAS